VKFPFSIPPMLFHLLSSREESFHCLWGFDTFTVRLFRRVFQTAGIILYFISYRLFEYQKAKKYQVSRSSFVVLPKWKLCDFRDTTSETILNLARLFSVKLSKWFSGKTKHLKSVINK
jgi:hypothetical protein